METLLQAPAEYTYSLTDLLKFLLLTIQTFLAVN